MQRNQPGNTSQQTTSRHSQSRLAGAGSVSEATPGLLIRSHLPLLAIAPTCYGLLEKPKSHLLILESDLESTSDLAPWLWWPGAASLRLHSLLSCHSDAAGQGLPGPEDFGSVGAQLLLPDCRLLYYHQKTLNLFE